MSSEIPSAVISFFNESQVPLTLCDPTQNDDPLILANTAFYQMSGYAPAEVLGRNCRFLQGRHTQGSIRKIIRDDYAAQHDTRVLIRNYRKDGEAFDNFLYIFTVMDARNRPLYRIGSQFEVPLVDKTTSFENHAAQLRDGLEKLNLHANAARQQMVRLVDVVGLSVRELLQARLTVLRRQI